MSDTAALRRRGVPTVTLCWEAFEHVAGMHARVLGIDDAPVRVYPGRRVEESEADDLQHVDAVTSAVMAELARYFAPTQ